MSLEAIPVQQTAAPLEHPMPDVHSYSGFGQFERKLSNIVESSDTEDEEQSKLLMVLVREIHTMKLILWWVLIIVPVIAIVLGIVLTRTAQPTIGQ